MTTISKKEYPGGTSELFFYKGVTIEKMWFGRWPFEFSVYPMYRSVGRENEVGGGGVFQTGTLEEAHQKIDRLLKVCGISEVPPPPPERPTKEQVDISITRDQMVAQIKTISDAMRIAASISSPFLQAVDGRPLLAWRYDRVAGCLRFVRLDENGNVTDAVVAINAPESRRAEYVSADMMYDPTILMLG